MRVWLARLLIGLVMAWNLQAAIAFLYSPGAFAPGFELSGPAGEAAVRGMAVLFLMWNVPYIVAAWQPIRQRLSLMEALAMQAVGVTGESAILLTLKPENFTLRGSILRFTIFDAAGLLALILAWWLVHSFKPSSADTH